MTPIVIRLAPDAGAAMRNRAEVLAARLPNTVIDDSKRFARDVPRYYVDALSEALRESWQTSTPYALDTGDEMAALHLVTRGPAAVSYARDLAEKWLRRRAALIVHRGPLHAFGLAHATREDSRLVYLPDFPVLNLEKGEVLDDFCLGFLGSSNAKGRTLPAGWQLLEWSRLTNCRSVLLVAGTGVGWLKDRARELGVEHLVTISSDFSQANAVLRDASGFYLPQSRNRIGHARTTGKLVEYLPAGKPVFTSPVGAALALLPVSMHLDPTPLNSPDQVAELARTTDRWRGLTREDRAHELARLEMASELLDAESRLDYWSRATELRLR